MLERAEQLSLEHHMLPPGSKVLCALSGGADSVCLLHWLWFSRERLGIQVCAAHYNHQLRGSESQRDEDFVRGLAEGWGVPLIVGRGDVAAAARASGRGLEETARAMRYRFLEETACELEAHCIATAHNADDNAETVLMHLLRGSGLRGLTGIAPVRGWLVRPLLTTKREEIEKYNRTYSLAWVSDSSNSDQTFTRNRIRGQLTPLLEELSPGVVERLGETARRLRRDEDCLTDQAVALLKDCVRGQGERKLPARLLAQTPEPIALRAVRLLVEELRPGNLNCGAVHLEGALALCRGDSPSAKLNLPGGLTARREYGWLVLTTRGQRSMDRAIPLAAPGETVAGDYRITCRLTTWQGEEQTPFRFWLKAGADGLTVRSRRTGDRLQCPGRPGKAVKKLFIDEKIPLHLRDGLPVLEGGGRVAAVAGLGPDIAFAPTPGEPAWEISIDPNSFG